MPKTSSLEDREPPLLGARAPSPALSAERELGVGHFQEECEVRGRAGAPALPVMARLDLNVDDFLGKAAEESNSEHSSAHGLFTFENPLQAFEVFWFEFSFNDQCGALVSRRIEAPVVCRWFLSTT